MRTRRFYIICILIFSSISIFPQKVHIKASDEPLSSVIKRLNTEVSFDNKVLSNYRVTLNKTFPTPYKALVFLLAGKPLQVNEVAGVYIITIKPQSIKPKPQKKKEDFKSTYKPITDPPPINLSISLDEIVITERSHMPTLKGEESNGINSFNSYTAQAMPGYSDNMVFNVLRMMPGIRASGEPSDELYVWGSSPGESRVSFDGIPLFTMQSYNSNISYINPYMFDEVKYKRGILSADEGSQTGAKVDVIQNSTQIEKPIFKAMISTMSSNCFSSIPVRNKCVVTIAYRHTLEGLFGGTAFDAYREKDGKKHSSDIHNTTITDSNSSNNSESLLSTDNTITITPTYRFQDINFDVVGFKSNNLSYKIAFYGAKDYLNFSSNDTINTSENQTGYQGEISFNLKKDWKDGNKSELSSSLSGLRSTQNGITDNIILATKERISQYNAKFEQIGIGSLHNLSFGTEFSTYNLKGSNTSKTAIQPSVFLIQKYHFNNLLAEIGIRTDFMSNKVNCQPRFLIKYQLMKYFTFTSAWGIYNQYLVKDPFSIYDGQYKFGWDLNSSLKSYNTVAGLAFDKAGLNISVESYLKDIRHSVWVVNNLLGKYNFSLKGMDIATKYNWRHGLAFASWSISKDPRQTDGVSNEVKAGGILRFYPFTFSANYIFSNGYNSLLLPTSSYGRHNNEKEVVYNSSTSYSRMDVSASYEKKLKYFGISTGISLINIFDTKNKKCITTWVLRDYTTTSHTQASRFTPIIFLEIKI